MNEVGEVRGDQQAAHKYYVNMIWADQKKYVANWGRTGKEGARIRSMLCKKESPLLTSSKK